MASTPTRRPRRRSGENRQRLIEAGLIEFGLYGFSGTSTAAIAARAEVPQPHVYVNFESKRDLFIACVEAASVLLTGRDSIASADGHERACAFVYQALAAARFAGLREVLVPALLRLYDGLGAEAFSSLFGAVGVRQLVDR